METPEVPVAPFGLIAPAGSPCHRLACGLGGGVATGVAGWARTICGSCVAWLIGAPRRAGARMYAINDAEARWWRWDTTECYDGLGRQYRDPRFEALPDNPALRRDELGADRQGPDLARPAGGPG
jgi:hypothetical protein